MTDEIVGFAEANGLELTKRPVREVLTDDHVAQIRYARENGVSWAVIARYFKDEHGIDYKPEAYRRTYGD